LHDKFQNYLQNAEKTNQFTNYGWAAKELEIRARDMLEIDESKAIIACCSGTAALHAMLWGIQRQDGTQRIGTQDFTFASNSIGPAEGPIVTDMKPDCNLNLDDPYITQSKILIVTNVFGHLQDLDYISEYYFPYIIFDNAACPYTFWEGSNSCNWGTGSYISLHHTKPIGFGEGGLAIIDKKYEESVRIATNFGIVDGNFNERSSNYKISEVSAAAILQWWDQFDINTLSNQYQDNYFKLKYEFRDIEGKTWINHSEDEKFFPNCFPFFAEEKIPKEISEKYEIKKYYKPLRGFSVATALYDNIQCFSITEGINCG
tara:strand:+ start:1010 stop:1960 length:951 start_codon:yes stop_codon:yes gene_type:complete